MKKLISAAAALLLTALSAAPAFAIADDYSPVVYFKAQSGLTTNEDGNIIIDREDLTASTDGVTVGIDVYVQDERLFCWYVAPKWKCASSYVIAHDLRNPLKDDGTGLKPYAYAETDEKGDIKAIRNSVYGTIDSECNTINYTCQRQAAYSGGVMDDGPLVPYGDKSDDYPLTSFEMLVRPDTPAGDYRIYFLTAPEDYPDQRYTQVSTRGGEGEVDRNFVPEVRDIHIIVVGDPDVKLGDVNMDGSVDASDASDVLRAYANLSTSQPHGLTPEQYTAADVNRDSSIDASDASEILRYYSYLSTGGTQPPDEFFN